MCGLCVHCWIHGERGRGGDEEGVKGVTEAMGGRGGGCDRGDGGGGEEGVTEVMEGEGRRV